MHTKISSKEQLQRQIFLLKYKQQNEFIGLESQYKSTVKELSFSNIVTGTVYRLIKENKQDNNLFVSLVSIVSGIFSKKIIVGKSNSFFKSFLGAIVKYLTTKLVANKIK